MAHEAIDKIRQAETAAEKLLKDAHDHAHKIIFEAKLEAERAAFQAQAQAQAESESALEKGLQAANGEASNISEKTRVSRDELKKSAQSRIEQAVNMIVEEAKKAWQ